MSETPVPMSDEVQHHHARCNHGAGKEVVEAKQTYAKNHQGEADHGAGKTDAHITAVFHPPGKVAPEKCPMSVHRPAKRVCNDDGGGHGSQIMKTQYRCSDVKNQ